MEIEVGEFMDATVDVPDRLHGLCPGSIHSDIFQKE